MVVSKALVSAVGFGIVAQGFWNEGPTKITGRDHVAFCGMALRIRRCGTQGVQEGTNVKPTERERSNKSAAQCRAATRVLKARVLHSGGVVLAECILSRVCAAKEGLRLEKNMLRVCVERWCKHDYVRRAMWAVQVYRT